MVGETDLRQVVGKLDGQFITLWLANRPVDFESYSAPDVARMRPAWRSWNCPTSRRSRRSWCWASWSSRTRWSSSSR